MKAEQLVAIATLAAFIVLVVVGTIAQGLQVVGHIAEVLDASCT